jgi:transcriptional regulator with XRE-family HTH domain
MADRSTSPASPSVTIGDLIRSRREALGLSRDELAQRLGPSMHAGDLYQLESARVLMPSWPRLLRLAEALDLSLDQLRTASEGCTSLVGSDGASGRPSDTASSSLGTD